MQNYTLCANYTLCVKVNTRYFEVYRGRYFEALLGSLRHFKVILVHCGASRYIEVFPGTMKTMKMMNMMKRVKRVKEVKEMEEMELSDDTQGVFLTGTPLKS